MPGVQISTDNVYLRVVQGNLVRKVDEGTEGARKRHYKTPKGQEGVAHELVYMAWEGVIRNISFKDNDFGKVCNIKFDDATISLPVDSRYFQDFACKIFNADLEESIIFHPYDMGEDKDRKTGISLKQGETKLSNYFYDFDAKKRLHGFPEPEDEKKDTQGYWKYYFSTVAAFLTDKIESDLKFKEQPEMPDYSNELEQHPDDIEIDDLPF